MPTRDDALRHRVLNDTPTLGNASLNASFLTKDCTSNMGRGTGMGMGRGIAQAN